MTKKKTPLDAAADRFRLLNSVIQPIVRETTTEVCYHCDKEFEAESDAHCCDAWICNDCAEGLIRAGIITDDYQQQSDEGE